MPPRQPPPPSRQSRESPSILYPLGTTELGPFSLPIASSIVGKTSRSSTTLCSMMPPRFQLAARGSPSAAAFFGQRSIHGTCDANSYGKPFRQWKWSDWPSPWSAAQRM